MQRFLTYSTSSPLLVTPKQSSTPYHWLTPGYYKNKVETNVFILPFIATYVTFPSTLWNWFQQPLRVLAPQVKKSWSNVWIWLCFLILNQFYVVNGVIHLIASYDFFVNRLSCCIIIQQQLQWAAYVVRS